MHKTKITSAEKIKTVELYLSDEGSTCSHARSLGVAQQSFQAWVRIYQSIGAEGLLSKSTYLKYSKETKIAAVEAYLSGEGSQTEICKKFKILSKTQLHNWIKLYNDHKELGLAGGHGSEIYMVKGRTTTYQERVEIVSFCIENDKDYGKTIDKYAVSYQQIYSWVRKYEEFGVQGLVDKRGKRKIASEMTEVEQLRAENRLLQAKIKQTEMENAILKKLKELEGSGY